MQTRRTALLGLLIHYTAAQRFAVAFTALKQPVGISQRHISYSSVQLAARRGRSKGGESTNSVMRGVKKENLPSKICVTCGRPFTWRKKWEKVWDEVSTCSKSCNRQRRESKQRAHDTDECSNGKDSNADVDEMPRRRTATNNRNEPATIQTSSAGAKNVLYYGNLLESDFGSPDTTLVEDTRLSAKEQRKANKKAQKAARRAEREGRGDPAAGQKQCDICSKSVDLLVRCMHEEGQAAWSMVCGKCWNQVSGGVPDGDADHPHYRYGGLWKNRRALR